MTTLAEAIILLTDRGSSSRFSNVDRNAATVGATLAELALAGNVTLNGDKKVITVDPSPTGNRVMDEVLAQLATDKPRKPSGWVSKLYWGFPNRVRDGLAAKGALTRTTSKVLHVRGYTATGPQAETEVRQRLRAAVDSGRSEDQWVAELAALVRALGMYKQALPDLPSAEAKRRVDAVAADSWAAEATRQAVTNNRLATAAAMIPIFTTVVVVIFQ